jgi:predicted nucleic acid-binding protein
VIVDTSALLAFFDAAEPAHDAVAGVIGDAAEPLVVSPYVVAELDYLVLTRHGSAAEIAVVAELAGGAWELATFDAARLRRAVPIIEKYRDQPLGVTDVSLLILAEDYGSPTIVTLDRRHFAPARLPNGQAPVILP